MAKANPITGYTVPNNEGLTEDELAGRVRFPQVVPTRMFYANRIWTLSQAIEEAMRYLSDTTRPVIPHALEWIATWAEELNEIAWQEKYAAESDANG